MISISPDTPEVNAELIADRRLDLDILSDDGLVVAERFGLVFDLPADLREVYQGFGIDLTHTDWRLPLPASYVIWMDGTVRYASVDPDYTVRPEPQRVVDAITARA